MVRNYLELLPTVDWTKFSFPDAVYRYEAHFIKLALIDVGGKITRAARLLRLKGHHSLNSLLKKQPDIQVKRSKQSIIPADTNVQPPTNSTVRILHVEDNDIVAGMAKELLEAQGWQVDGCTDGNEGLERISGDAHYDLLLLDYDLPGVSALELLRRARKLTHRTRTPIVVLSATPIGASARKAGADVFLQKPQDVTSLVEIISQLLGERNEKAGEI